MGGLDQGDLFSTFTPGEEEEGIWKAYQAHLRLLDEFVAGSWIFRADNFEAIMSSRPVDEV